MNDVKKYKPCCGKRCLLGNCKHRESGACYCCCRLLHEINELQSVISGITLYDGRCFVFFPSKESREENLNKWCDEDKEKNRIFREIEAPKLLEEYLEDLKKYEI